jgi:allantoicase
VHGEVVPDPRLLGGGYLDLAALASGARVTGCSNMFYSSPSNLISPGLARNMGEGWETARRRDDANDWVEIRLAAPGVARLAELDTSHFVGNAPGWASLQGHDRRAGGDTPPEPVTLLPRTRLQPDTPHRFRLGPGAEVTDIRLDIYPDGGMARLRLFGALTDAARDGLALRWFNLLPEPHAAAVLAAGGDAGRAVLAARPLSSVAQLPAGLRAQLRG